MKGSLTVLILASLLLTSCVISKATPTVSSSEIATQVNQILTAIPTATTAPTSEATATATKGVITATSAPTNTAVAQATATSAPSATSAPTATTQATAIPTTAPTATLAPTITLPATDPTLKFGAPTFQDTFKNDHNWPMGANDLSSISISGGILKLTALTTTDGWRLTWPVGTNYYVEMDAKSDNCSGSDHFGLIVRVPNLALANQGYLYGITCDGSYYLNKWDSKVLTALVKPTANSNILKGPNQVNRLGIWLNGNTLGLYVNGVKLTEATDSTFTKGGFGIFVGSRTTTQIDVLVNKISYWANPQ